MKRWEKILAKLSPKERRQIKKILEKIKARDTAGLDLKKLRGHAALFRVRKGDIRIIFRITDNDDVSIVAIERRGDTTYNI